MHQLNILFMKKNYFILFITFLFSSFCFGQYLTEGFEGGTSIPAGWTLGQTNANETWYIGTNQAQANTGSNYAIVEYDAALGNQNEDLTTPSIDLTSATNPRLIFYWNMSYYWGVDPFDNYDFTVSVDNGSTITQVFTETDEVDFDSSGDNFVWFQRTIDLSSYVGETITIIFNYSGSDGASLTLDDVLVEETPTCPIPTGVTVTTNSTTEASVSWSAGGSETQWTYEYGITGFTLGTGTSASVNTTSVDISGLSAEQSYDIYVQANCAGGDNSPWTQLVSWTMPSPPIVPNYVETFDSYPSDRWTEASGAYGTPTGSSSDFIGDDFVNDTSHQNGQSAKVNIYGPNIDEYLVSPKFNLSGATYYLNFEIGLVDWNTTTATTLGADDYVAFLVTQDNGANWTELMRWDSTTPISEVGQSVSETELSGYGDSVQFAFYAFSDTSNADTDFYIDNFQITDTTLGIDNNNLEGFNIFPTIVKSELFYNSQSKIDNISIFDMLGKQVMNFKPSNNSSSLNLSSLRKGIYLVNVMSENRSGIYKIIKE